MSNRSPHFSPFSNKRSWVTVGQRWRKEVIDDARESRYENEHLSWRDLEITCQFDPYDLSQLLQKPSVLDYSRILIRLLKVLKLFSDNTSVLIKIAIFKTVLVSIRLTHQNPKAFSYDTFHWV